MRLRDLPDDVNHISGEVLDAAIEVHRPLGVGLLKNGYHRCLAHELSLRGFRVEVDPPLALNYKGMTVNGCYFPDLIVNGLDGYLRRAL